MNNSSKDPVRNTTYYNSNNANNDTDSSNGNRETGGDNSVPVDVSTPAAPPETSVTTIMSPVTDSMNNGKSHVVNESSTARCWSCCLNCFLAKVQERFALLHWIGDYNWKIAIKDVIAGLAVASMQLSQGLAYAMLSNAPLIMGIYTAVFPVFVYFLLGTSKHLSLGTHLITCFMVGNVVDKYTGEVHLSPANGTLISKVNPLEVVITVTFTVGVIELIMYFCGLHVISHFIPQPHFSGFTTGVALHILVLGIKQMLGLQITAYSGFNSVIHTGIDIFKNIGKSNLTVVYLSACCVTILLVSEIFLRHLLLKRCNIFLPIEFLVVIGIIIYFACTGPGEIDTLDFVHAASEFAMPTYPNLSLLMDIAFDSAVIAVVAYCTSTSTAYLFAGTEKFEVNSETDLLAHSVGNLCGSLFLSLPVASSLSRSEIHEKCGGQTQLAIFFSCLIIIPFIPFFEHIFKNLPVCVLSCIILIALYPFLYQVTAVKAMWKLSQLDVIGWLVTCLSVVVFGVNVGFACGILSALICNMLVYYHPYMCVLGQMSLRQRACCSKLIYGVTGELNGVKIIQAFGPINTATADHVVEQLFSLSGMNPYAVRKIMKIIDSAPPNRDDYVIELESMKKVPFKLRKKNTDTDIIVYGNLTYVILDVSCCEHWDFSGMLTINSAIKAYGSIGVEMIVVSSPSSTFHNINDAIKYIQLQLAVAGGTEKDS